MQYPTMLVMGLAAVAAFGQQAPTTRPDELAKGKLLYVGPMPYNLDKWLQQDMQAWGKYKVTANPEGVDLKMEAYVPEREQFNGRIPRPKSSIDRAKDVIHPGRCPRLGPKEVPAATVTVVDWVTNERLWYAHLLDKRSPNGIGDVAEGEHTDLYVHGLTPDQIAMKITRSFRDYVEAHPGGGK